VQGWRQIEHKAIILVHSNELHPLSPNPRWNPLTNESKHLHNHCSWTLQELGTPCWKTLFQHTQLFKKPYKEESYNYTLQRIKRWNEYIWYENAEICLRPVEQNAHNDNTSNQALEPSKNKHSFCFWKTFKNSCLFNEKIPSLCCKTCFLNVTFK